MCVCVYFEVFLNAKIIFQGKTFLRKREISGEVIYLGIHCSYYSPREQVEHMQSH